MEIIQLHSFGENDHLKVIKEKFIALKSKIFGNKNLTHTQKNTELSKLKKKFKESTKNVKKNLY